MVSEEILNMGWLDLLANPAVGNLLILIAAIVGVGGSYYIYHIRLENRKKSARRALKSELESMTFFTQWIEKSESIPQHSITTTMAYESHIETIGLLNDAEIDKLTTFYSSAVHIDKILESNREIILQSGLVHNAVDMEREYREDVIASRLDRLAVWRWQALQILKKNMGEPYEPPEHLDFPELSGDIIHQKHPLFNSNKEQLLSDGYFESVEGEPDLYRLTDDGKIGSVE
jgi:hypothetical protein